MCQRRKWLLFAKVLLHMTLFVLLVVWMDTLFHFSNSKDKPKEKSYHTRWIPFSRNLQSDSLSNWKQAWKQKRRFPQAFILGAGKCGTGALRWFLSMHPQVVTHKQEEMWFYDTQYSKGEDWHLEQMPLSLPNQVTLETSPGYFHEERAMKRIVKRFRDAKFMVILRNPIDRAMSQYLHMIAEGPNIRGGFNVKPNAADFEKLTMKENGHINDEWDAINYGFYVYPLQRWLKYVPLSRLLVVDGSAFAKTPLPQLKKIETFLRIRGYFDESTVIYNNTKGFYCLRKPGGQTVCLPGTKGRKHPEITKQHRKKMADFYKPYNEYLYKTIGQRFGWK